MAAKRAWQLEDEVDDDDRLVSAHEQLVDLLGALAETLRVVGGQLSVATLRQDTGERIAGVKVFETQGYVVQWTDFVPGVLPATVPEPDVAELDAAADADFVDEQGEA